MKEKIAKEVLKGVLHNSKSNPSVNKWFKRVIIFIIAFVVLSIIAISALVYVIFTAVIQPALQSAPDVTIQGQQLLQQGRTLLEGQLQQQIGEQTQELKVIEGQLKTIQDQLNQLITPTPGEER